jgi:acetylxylan esterase
MMTNNTAGSYPEIFAAGTAFAGPTSWNSAGCAEGVIVKTPEGWGGIIRDAYKGYRVPRPKMALRHVSNDTVLYTQVYYEAIKQWKTFGV